jgi:hypothetical protein
MSFTAIAPVTPVGPYPAGGVVGATALNLVETACDTVNGNSFIMTGHEVLLLHNTDASAHTVTLSSASDSKGRSGDITTYSIPANTIAVFDFRGGLEGWQQSDGTVHFTGVSALIKAAILTFPN